MNLSDLEATLKLVTSETYEREAPPGITRAIVWHRYNIERLDGDDRLLLGVDRVQLDLFWQHRNDTLLNDLIAVLSYWRLPFTLEDLTWDDERQLYRGIVQLTVV